MLLLTSLTFGGSKALASFEHLPAEAEELLKHRAQAILQRARDKRVPLLVQEMRRLFVAQPHARLGAASSRLVASVLAKERPALVEAVLRALPG